MTNNNYDKYWYFRNVTNEDSDSSQATSIILPLSKLVSMIPTSTTTMRIYFEKATAGTPVFESTVTGQHGSIELTIKQGKVKETIAALIALLNSGPKHNDGIKVIVDDSTIDFDDTTRKAVYFSHITGCGSINAR